jgi:hypothetical protein
LLSVKAEDINNLYTILCNYEYIELYIKEYGTNHELKHVEEFLKEFEPTP